MAAKARAVVTDHVGVGGDGAPDVRPGPFPGGAVVRVGDDGWVLLDERPERGLGPALVWARRQGVQTLNVIVEDPAVAGIIARRATAFADAPVVWRLDGRRIQRADPAPPPPPSEPPAAARELIVQLRAAGVEVVVEAGEIRGEIRGLEVARVVVDDDGTARIDTGVGRHDREAFAMVHGGLPTAEALASVVRSVEVHRRADAEAHPLRRLAPEGWLRWRLVEEPSLVGLRSVTAAPSTVARDSVKDTAATIALGVDDAGERVVVACSVGIDLDLVPAAADARLALDPSARLVLVVPERDDHPVTRRLAAALLDPADVVPVAGDWRSEPGTSS